MQLPTGWRDFARKIVLLDAAKKANDGDIELALWLASDDAEMWADMANIDQTERLRVALLALVQEKKRKETAWEKREVETRY